MTVMSYEPAHARFFGWCSACHAGGRFVPAVDEQLLACQMHLRLLPRRPAIAGQLALPVDVVGVPPALRAPHVTGVQLWCADCVARGAVQPRQGMPERIPGDATPLCLTCWRSRNDRAHRGHRRGGLTADEAGWAADLTERLTCEVCGRADGAGGCWRCGDQVTYLEAARAVHAHDQAQAAAELERAEDLALEHKAALRRVRRAQRRLQVATEWRERVERVVAALPRLTKTGSRGQLKMAQGATGWARAWELVADFLARDAADRTARGLNRRGRPPEYPLVVAVMAVAAGHESGHESMAGLHWTALFADVSQRTVTTGWARAVALGSAELVEHGRILTLEEREELKRHRQRAVYDFTPLHLSPFDAEPYRGTASALLAQLLRRAVELVDEHQASLDEAGAAAAAVSAELLDVQAWQAEQRRDDLVMQAELNPAWTDEAAQAAQLARAARGRACRAAAPPTDSSARIAAQRAARAAGETSARAVDNAFEQARRMASFCDHPREGLRRRSSSGSYWGLLWKPPAHTVASGRRPNGRGEDHVRGASRPAPTRNAANRTLPSRPRTVKRERPASPRRTPASAVMWWAKPLARALSGRWDFLQRFLDDAIGGRVAGRVDARERGLRLRQIAATLGCRLGPEWTAADVVRLVERHGLIGFSAQRGQVIAAGDAHSPLSYLAQALDRALTSPDAIVPHLSPVREAYERDVLVVEVAAAAATSTTARAQLDARDAAAAASRAGEQAGLQAARAAAASAGGRTVPRPTRYGDAGDVDRMAQARAELAVRPAVAVPDEWPDTRRPGAGLPEDWDPSSR